MNASSETAKPPEPVSPSLRRELAAVGVFTLIGAFIRFWHAGSLGLLHFDEGIYALAGLWIRSPLGWAGYEPSSAFYAPPVFPTLVGLFYLLLGVGDTSALLVSLLAGTAGIPVAALVARHAFGPGAGAAAAALVALCGPHVALSRMALVDSLFLLVFLAALGLGMAFLGRPGLLRAIPFGLAVGLAQLTKYNGLLAGLSVAMVPLLGLVSRAPSERRWAARALLYGLVAAGIAWLVYWPWFEFVQTRVEGGYPAVVRHHSGYVKPLNQWPGNALQQWAQAIALSGKLWGWLNWQAVGWLLAWLSAAWSLGRLGGLVLAGGFMARLTLASLPLGASVMGVLADAPWCVSLACLPWAWRTGSHAIRALAAAWAVQTLLLPIYHPYARLALPLELLSLLIGAGALRTLLAADLRPEARPTHRWAVGLAIAGAALLLPRLAGGFIIPAPGLLARTDGLKNALARHEWDPRRPYFLAGRPAILYYLITSGKPLKIVRGRDFDELEQIMAGPRSGGERAGFIFDGAIEPDSPLLRNRAPEAGCDLLDGEGNGLVTDLDIDPRMAFGPARRPGLDRLASKAANPAAPLEPDSSHPCRILICEDLPLQRPVSPGKEVAR